MTVGCRSVIIRIPTVVVMMVIINMMVMVIRVHGRRGRGTRVRLRIVRNCPISTLLLAADAKNDAQGNEEEAKRDQSQQSE